VTGPELAGLFIALTLITASVLGWIARGVHRVEHDALEADIQARADRLTAQAETETRFAAITSGLFPRGDES
jgi:archaellum component FlaG (FlaF/FlaG flagellin family)